MFDTDIGIQLGAVVAEGDIVVVEERMRVTLPGGRPYDVEYCVLFERRDGLIHRVREYLPPPDVPAALVEAAAHYAVRHVL